MPATRPDWSGQRAKGDGGASLVEYALLLGLIALVCVLAVTFFGSQVGSSFSKSGTSLSGGGFGT